MDRLKWVKLTDASTEETVSLGGQEVGATKLNLGDSGNQALQQVVEITSDPDRELRIQRIVNGILGQLSL